MASIIWEQQGTGKNFTRGASTGLLAVLEFDCTPTENHEASVEITEHPVEVGVNMTDHAKPNQRVITLEGMITNTPINETTIGSMFPIASVIGSQVPLIVTVGDRPGQPMLKRTADASLAGGFVSPFSLPLAPRSATRATFVPSVGTPMQQTASGSVFSMLTREDRVKTCYDALVQLCLSARQITLVTDLEEYDSCFIKKLGAPRQGMDSIKFSIEIRQVRFADTQLVDIRRKKPREKRAEVETNKGPTARYKPVTAAQDGLARAQLRAQLEAQAGQSLPEE
jgi:hypothetical protein